MALIRTIKAGASVLSDITSLGRTTDATPVTGTVTIGDYILVYQYGNDAVTPSTYSGMDYIDGVYDDSAGLGMRVDLFIATSTSISVTVPLNGLVVKVS